LNQFPIGGQQYLDITGTCYRRNYHNMAWIVRHGILIISMYKPADPCNCAAMPHQSH